MDGVSVFLYVLMIALLAAAYHEKTRKRLLACRAVAALEERIGCLERYYWLGFALCMIAGVAVRCYRFGELPLGVNQDGAMAGVEAYSLLQTGRDQHGFSWPTYFEAWEYSQMSTLYSYVLIPFIKLFGRLDIFVLRLPMLLASVAMLPLIWDLARRMLGKSYALLTLFVAAINPWQIMQSRWALEANLMPHVFLIGVYLLFIGRKKRAALYASMVFFGLAPYAYGLASFSVPVFLLICAVHYLVRKKASVLDVVICVAVFAAVAWPYFYTMAINAFGLETVEFGPFTLPYFEMSHRKNDLVFGQPNPYQAMVRNLFVHMGTYLYTDDWTRYNAIAWAGTMYKFLTPVFVLAAYRLWLDRRALADRGEEHPFREGGVLILAWLCAAAISGMMVGGVINRNNIVFYPLILLSAYGLHGMGKRLKTALLAAVVAILVGFGGFCATYFADEEYQQRVGASFNEGLYEALVDTWGWDYDQYYVSNSSNPARDKIVKGYVMLAHRIDYSMLSEETDLINPDGESTGWYFTERYVIQDFEEFEPDPMECAVYIVTQKEKELFDEQNYIMTDYADFAAVYPRYWAE